MDRFSEELETINVKQSISKNRSNQHANRLAIIKMNMEKDTNEYNGAGIGILAELYSTQIVFNIEFSEELFFHHFRINGFM